jgi:hypothetical protein
VKKIFWAILIFVLWINLAGCSISNVPNNNINYKNLYEKSLIDQPPIIKDIRFDGKSIDVGSWVEVGEKVKVSITLEGDCQEAYLYYTPTGSAVYKEQKLLEIVDVEPGKDIAEYTWTPNDIHGFFQIIAFNKNVGRRSELYNVTSKQ